MNIRWSLTRSHVYWWPDGAEESRAPQQVAGDYSGNVDIEWPHDFVPRKGDHILMGTTSWVLCVEEILWLPDGGVLVYLTSDRRWH